MINSPKVTIASKKNHDYRYVALLAGINVGGRTIKMADLKALFESLGFTEVKTLLASGNVLFTV